MNCIVKGDVFFQMQIPAVKNRIGIIKKQKLYWSVC